MKITVNELRKLIAETLSENQLHESFVSASEQLTRVENALSLTVSVANIPTQDPTCKELANKAIVALKELQALMATMTRRHPTYY